MKYSLANKIQHQFNRIIDNWGIPVRVTYQVSKSTCLACGFDPINNEAVNPYCSTCNGTGFVITSTTKAIRAIHYGTLGTLGSMGFITYGQYKFNILPEGQSRITCKLSDVIFNRNSATSDTIFNLSSKVFANNLNYVIKSVQRLSLDIPYICVVTLEQIK